MNKESRRAIVWFRNDLRLHDNEALLDAIQSAGEIIPAYIFDPRVFMGKTKYGFTKTGKYRAKFIIESVLDLKSKLQQLGSDLYIRIGNPEEELLNLALEVKSSWVFCNRERTQEEEDVQDALENKLWAIGQEIRYSRGKMLFYTADLPFPVTHTPDIFTQFRKEVEKFIPVREPLPTPSDRFNKLSIAIEYGEVPSLSDFGYDTFEANDKGGYLWKGGETEALNRLKYYLWDKDLIVDYKKTRDGLLGKDFSSKFSPWLAQGCLSPKMIYSELKKYEIERTKNKSTYWMFFELMWRDFFRLTGKKFGNAIFQSNGIKNDGSYNYNEDSDLFNKWAKGETGIPFIDANMRELNATGFMSNRGRQNVASFLVKDLNLNWVKGAEYFESLLIDYDPCSNYGNWNYIAGVGADPKEDRYFNIISQAKRYDSTAEYVKFWIPELKDVPSDELHTIDSIGPSDLSKYNIQIGKDYPESVLSTSKWV
jgi:deoxyribodipyrimidine photo-lyase